MSIRRVSPRLHVGRITEMLGDGVENIKVVKNFMPKEHIDLFLEYIQLQAKFRTLEEEDMYINRCYYQRELLRVYEHLMRSELMKMYEIDFERDRAIDLNNREDGSSLPVHTDFIQSQFIDPLEPPPVYSSENDWSGHFSSLIYLNDNFSGGEIYFPKQGLKIKPESGMLIAFPGNKNYEHSVEEFKGSERFALSLWTRVKA
jgi:hypothetical protein